MSKTEKHLASTGAMNEAFWSHSQPQLGLDRLIPSIMGMDVIDLEALPQAMTSHDVIAELEARGATVTEIPFKYYRDATYSGVTRQFSHDDLLKGKEPLWDTVDLALEVTRGVSDLVSRMLEHYRSTVKKGSLLASMELQDLEKITIQQWKPVGWFVQSPVTDAEVPRVLSDQALEVLRRVAQEYGRILRTLPVAKGSFDLILQDDDPPDTMTGAPTFAAGERTHEARVAILAALPSPRNMSAQDFIMEIAALGDRLNLPEHVIYSPVVSTRSGPLKKPVKLWVRDQGGYTCTHQATGAYNRTRFVFPAPYYVNFLLSPLYVQMSSVRQKKLGLWHDPESQSRYIPVLQKQGKHCYSIDFSGMDTGMFPNVIDAILAAIGEAGFAPWPVDFFRKLYPRMGVVLPDFAGSTSKCNLLTGPIRPWCSGFKLTSEFDTIYGAAVLLTALSQQIPNVIDLWEKGKFVFLELGDDIMFTTDWEIDPMKLSQDALHMWGAKLEIIQDAMFLKWFLPLTPEIPKMTRSMSRFIQQTFFNEDKYSGVEGGTRPDAVMRLGLMARLEGLANHPDLGRWWPDIYSLLLKLRYIERASPAYKSSLSQAKPVLDEGDDRAILEYAMRQPTYFANLAERAKYEPSAGHLMRLALQLGVNTAGDPQQATMRQLYYEALMTDPTEADIERLRQFVTPFLEW